MTQPDLTALTIGVLGGTGPQGRGLAYRFAAAGLSVVVGSRSADRGTEIANELSTKAVHPVRGGDNRTCASDADVVLAVVPWDGHAELLTDLRDALAGKIVVDCVNPLGFDAKGPFALTVPEGSAAQQAAALLPDSRVTAAFHHLSAVHLEDVERTSLDTDVLVLGDDRDATDVVRALADTLPGVRGVYGGRLRNTGQVEAFTANLIAVNRRYKVHAGLRVTDI